MTISTRIEHVLTGRVVPFGPHGEPSGIDKQCVEASVTVTRTGLSGDAQGDTRHHGGPEKAVHHYPRDHYAAWRADHPELAWRLEAPGAFGENISTHGLTENDVCIGDVFRLGTAVVQVSQGRQPCWRLNLRFAEPAMARRVQKSGRTGWYYRVLEEGQVSPGDRLVQIGRPQPDWPLARLLHLLYRDTMNSDALAAIAGLSELAESWRSLASRRMESRAVEDWDRRLITPQR